MGDAVHPVGDGRVVLRAPVTDDEAAWCRLREESRALHAPWEPEPKPGFDPCEVFWGWPPPGVSQNVRRIQGSHGRIGENRRVAFASTLDLGETPTSHVELARVLRNHLT